MRNSQDSGQETELKIAYRLLQDPTEAQMAILQNVIRQAAFSTSPDNAIKFLSERAPQYLLPLALTPFTAQVPTMQETDKAISARLRQLIVHGDETQFIRSISHLHRVHTASLPEVPDPN